MRHDVIRQVVRRAQSLVGLPVEPIGKRSVLQLELFGPLALKSRQVLKLPADCREFTHVRNAQQLPFGLRRD